MFKKDFKNDGFKPARLLWEVGGGAEIHVEPVELDLPKTKDEAVTPTPETVSPTPEESLEGKDKELSELLATQDGKTKTIRFLESRSPYGSGDWRKWNKGLAKEFGVVENVDAFVESMQRVTGSKNPDGQFGPKSATRLAKHVGLPEAAQRFPRKSTRKELDDLQEHVKTPEEIEQMKFNANALYADYVEAINNHGLDDASSYQPDRGTFLATIDNVIDHTNGDIDVHDFYSWRDAFNSANLSEADRQALSVEDGEKVWKRHEEAMVQGPELPPDFNVDPNETIQGSWFAQPEQEEPQSTDEPFVFGLDQNPDPFAGTFGVKAPEDEPGDAQIEKPIS